MAEVPGINESLAIAWAAGIFEGEGCISIYSKHNQLIPTVRLVLRMTDEDVVRRFVKCINGNPSNIKKITNKEYKPIYHWDTASRPEVVRILVLFMPYFGIRRKEKASQVLSLPPQTKPRKIKYA